LSISFLSNPNCRKLAPKSSSSSGKSSRKFNSPKPPIFDFKSTIILWAVFLPIPLIFPKKPTSASPIALIISILVEFPNICAPVFGPTPETVINNLNKSNSSSVSKPKRLISCSLTAI